MILTEFYEEVEAHNNLSGALHYKDNGDVEFIITYLPMDKKTVVPLQTVFDNNWKDLEAVLTCKVNPTRLIPMTRVVGYYSRTDNWNKSKIGELKDRQCGSYHLKEGK